MTAMTSITMIKEILDFNKKAFDDSFNAIIVVQDHAEKMVRAFWGNSMVFPDQGKNVIGDWVNTYKNGLNDFKANVDSRFKFIESYLLNAADQIESSFNAVAKKTDQVTSSNQIMKKIAADIKKAAPGRQVVKKEKVAGKKTAKQK